MSPVILPHRQLQTVLPRQRIVLRLLLSERKMRPQQRPKLQRNQIGLRKKACASN